MIELKVVSIYKTTLLDIPGKLRELADAIERGVHGDVLQCAVVSCGQSTQVFAFGDTNASDAHLMFGAAQFLLAKAVAEA